MVLLFRVIVGAWALISVGLSALAFFVITGYGDTLAAAVQEGFETVPEALMQVMGFDGAPIAVVVAYWLALALSLFLAFKPTGGRS